MGYYDIGRTDGELLAAFEGGELEGKDFPHEAHVRVTWLLVQRDGREQALAEVVRGIRDIARRAGRPEVFHETITRAWFELIAQVDDLDAHPELADRDLLSRHYTRERLASGREQWVDPDLAPLRLPPSERSTVDLPAVMRHIPAVVAVLGTHASGAVHAATVSSTTSLSRQPPLVLVCLAEWSRALALTEEAGAFTLTFLSSAQHAIAEHFADPSRPVGAAGFAGVPHRLTPYGPVIGDAASWLGCRLGAVHPGGDHRIVVGEVADGHTATEHPLLRHDGAYL